MNFMQAVQAGFKNYFDFKGRASRSEYWYWVLFVFLLTIVTMALDLALFPPATPEEVDEGPISAIGNLVTLIPGMSLAVRRLHDVNRRWWWLLTIIPPLIWAFVKGTPGDNRFGPDPLSFYVPKRRAL